MGVVIGVDVGQKRDPTAVAVVEVEERVVDQEVVRLGSGIVKRNEKTEYHNLVRHLERLPLGSPYPTVADRLAVIVEAVENREDELDRVYVDATGVGAPVVDLMRERVSARIVAVYFTHGDRRVEHSRRDVTLGKAFLVSRLQALLQTCRVHLPRTPEAKELAEELMDYEIRVDRDANDRYGAFRVGTHDDLVTALGLAVQVEPKRIQFARV